MNYYMNYIIESSTLLNILSKNDLKLKMNNFQEADETSYNKITPSIKESFNMSIK